VQVAKTIADRIAATGGRATGFDYMRIVLAVSIIAYHTIATCYGKAAEREITSGVFRAPIAMLLPMFFALSGFLVAGSLERSRTLVMFLGLRAVRIFPALAVEIALSARSSPSGRWASTSPTRCSPPTSGTSSGTSTTSCRGCSRTTRTPDR
jgi:peptidoglycan/LPS O-acetylase OafA/YrhL